MVAIIPDQNERDNKDKNRDISIATLNVDTMRGRSSENVEMLSRGMINICFVRESRWRSESARKIAGRNSHYKIFWKRNDSESARVGELVGEKWIDSVISVVRYGTGLIMLQSLCGKSIINFVCAYAPGPHSQGFSQHHIGYGYGTRNQEGMSILDLCAATDLS